jgi:hypothetical protein
MTFGALFRLLGPFGPFGPLGLLDLLGLFGPNITDLAVDLVPAYLMNVICVLEH